MAIVGRKMIISSKQHMFEDLVEVKEAVARTVILIWMCYLTIKAVLSTMSIDIVAGVIGMADEIDKGTLR